VILYFLWKQGLLSRVDGEKLRFFLGLTPNPLYLSRRWPLLTAVSWPRALFSPAYARSLCRWLAYRVELFDGLRG
jgi:hypothetical protein